ncbi:MAG: metallophosphoesterase family protein [Acidobacteriota bacterium]
MSLKRKNSIATYIFVIVSFISGSFLYGKTELKKLPVIDPALKGRKEMKAYRVHNKFGINMIRDSIKDGNKRGLLIDLNSIKKTLNGKSINNKKIYGYIYAGPYPFETSETNYTYKRLRTTSVIKNGYGYINISDLLGKNENSEGWIDTGEVYVKLNLFLQNRERDRKLGNYELITRFKKEGEIFKKLPVITEGPFINMVHSDDPSTITISFRTDKKVSGKVKIEDMGDFTENLPVKKHEIKITGLNEDTTYNYSVRFKNYVSKGYKFKTAPSGKNKKLVFVYTGDSRAGTGYEESNVMGMNSRTMERIANFAYLKGAEFILQGGDMINGRTTSIPDFRTQLYSWKNSLSGYWHERPVYTCQGNHESLVRAFRDKDDDIIKMDKWPYETESTEAVFADELVHFENGPDVSDPRRPTYKENVYSFRYGSVKFIVMNNNYWLGPVEYGGLVEGYIMEDQMQWIEKELKDGEEDSRVKFIILFAQEPVFPNGGHLKDSMWYFGDNSIRGSSYDEKSGKVIPEKEGIIEVRNRFVRMVASNRKIAAVLGSDEHGYHKVLIDNSVPIGKSEEKKDFSPLKDLKYPTWYIVSGGAGAPYYSEEPTPWNKFWKKNIEREENNLSGRGCYYYSSQENYFLFTVENGNMRMEVYNPYGEIIDTYKDLMSQRKN